MISRHYRFFFLFLMACGLAGMIFLYYQHRTSNHLKARQDISPHRYPKHHLQIRGFQFDGTYEGKRVISIKADKFAIEKKKLGFFRLGLITVARFTNAVIDIYGKRRETGKDAASKSPGQTADMFQTNARLSQGITFKEAFTRDALPAFPVKRISSIMIEPVCLNLYDEKSLVAQITASSATIRLKQRDILFKGGVRVVSGSRVLTTDQLVIFPENAVIKTDRHFLLKTPERKLEGERLTTDIFLNVVSP